jgi:SAM-dependent methyltransferase
MASIEIMVSPFEGKGAVYHKYRGDYSRDAIAALLMRTRLTRDDDVADLGAGTGILTRHLLGRARRVYAVEPAADMRRAAEGGGATWITGTAEETTLADRSVDVVTCGNSFHYFDPDRARDEVTRILRPRGRVAILFSDMPLDPDDFVRDYASFLQRHTPPQLTSVHSADDHKTRIARFFDGCPTTIDSGNQSELLTWDQLRGRYLSSSLADENALDELRALFDRYERDNVVTLRLTWTCIACDSF